MAEQQKQSEKPAFKASDVLGRKRKSAGISGANGAAAAGAGAGAHASTVKEEGAAAAAQTNDDGQAYFEISARRRVTVRQFKKMTLVDIREFYEKGGQSLPGKKGISLTLAQFNSLVGQIPQIRAAVAALDGDSE